METNNFLKPDPALLKKNEVFLTNEFNPNFDLNVNNIITNLKQMIGNVKSNLKDKKMLTVFGILNLIWIILSILSIFKINSFIIKLISWITFFQGGFIGNVFNRLGGFIGKFLYTYLISSLVINKNYLMEIKNNVVLFKEKLNKKNLSNPFFLIGVGLSLIIYNIIVGYMNFSNIIIGITLFILSLKNLKNNNIVSNIFLKVLECLKLQNQESLNNIIMGWTSGYLVGIILSFITKNSGYLLGIILFITSIVLSFINNKKEGVKQ